MARIPPASPAEPKSRKLPRSIWLILLAGLLAGIVGVVVIRRLAGPAQTVVDLDALERRGRARQRAEQHLTEAVRLLQENRLDAAITAARVAAQSAPSYAPAQLLLARLYLLNGRPAEAEAPATRAVELAPDDPEAHFELGHVHLAMRAGRGATEEFRKAIALLDEAGEPVPVRYRLSLAEAYSRQGQGSLADQQVDLALRADREETLALCRGLDYETLMAVARVLTRQGEHEQASDLFMRAARLQPDLPEPQYWAARSCLAVGKREQALQFIEQALKLEPLNERYRALRRQIGGGRDTIDLPGRLRLE